MSAHPITHMTLPATTVGILAGLGPLAGAEFYRRLIECTPARDDSEHLGVVLVSNPDIPSRVEHLLGHGPSPVPALTALAKMLEGVGASVIAIPSSTTHAYHAEIQQAVNVPVLHLLAEVTAAIGAMGSRRPAMLATTATVQLELYTPHFDCGLDPLYPDAASQRDVQQVVESMKAGGDHNRLTEVLAEIASRPWARSADCVVLACTELCLLSPREGRLPMVSATDVLVGAVLGGNGRRVLSKLPEHTLERRATPRSARP